MFIINFIIRGFISLITINILGNSYAYSLPNERDFNKIKDKMGSNPGGVYEKDNELFYLKFPAKINFPDLSEEKRIKKAEKIARNEVFASQIYKHAGIKTPDLFFIKDRNNHLGTASKMIPNFKTLKEAIIDKEINIENFANLEGVQEGLIIDALLANWDVAGGEFDNIGMYIDPSNGQKNAVRVDVGGAGFYSGTGLKKRENFRDTVIEWDLLRGINGSIFHPMSKIDRSNILSAQLIFGNISDSQIKKAIEIINKLDENAIKNLIDQYIDGSEKSKNKLLKKLVNRKNNLLCLLNNELNNFNPDEVKERNKKLRNTRYNQMLEFINKAEAQGRKKIAYINILDNYLEPLKTLQNNEVIPTVLKADNNVQSSHLMVIITNPINQINSIINDRILSLFSRNDSDVAGVSAGENTDKNNGLWIKAIVSHANQKGSSFNNGYKGDSSGTIIGYDFGEEFKIGVAFSYLNTKVKSTHETLAEDIIKNYAGHLYIAKNFKNHFFVSAGVLYGNLYRMAYRKIAGTEDIIRGESPGNVIKLQVSSGYDYKIHTTQLHFIPSIGFSHEKITFKPHEEKHIKNTENYTTIDNIKLKRIGGLLTLRTNYNFKIRNYSVIPEISARVHHSLFMKDSTTKVMVNKLLNQFLPPKASLQKTIYTFGINLRVANNFNYDVAIGYDYNLAKKFNAHNFYGCARIEF